MQNYNQLTIDLSAVQRNLKAIANSLPPQTCLMPMVKASAYGTDDHVMSKFYSENGIEILGVSHVQEAVSLREKGIRSSLFVIGPAAFEIDAIVTYELEVTVDHPDFCLALNKEALRQNKKISVHLHLDTGMKRFGCRLDEALKLAECICSLPGLQLNGILTHYVAAENKQFDSFSQMQTQMLEKLYLGLKEKGIHPRWIHAANSSGALRFRLPFCNMVRLGLAVFGFHSSQEEKASLPLKPALKLETRVHSLMQCYKGETVGYLQEYMVKKPKETIAILPIGYHDGLLLQYSGKGYVLIRGKKAPLIGRICMDFMMVEVTDIPGVSCEDPALIFGQDAYGNTLSAETVAGWANTNVRELLVCLGPRVKRNFIFTERIDESSRERFCDPVCAL